MFALLDRIGVPRVKAIGLSMGAKTLLHMATQQPARIDAMVLVSATPYFPAPARAAMAQLSVDTFSGTDWAAQRLRHPQGDDQIRMLFEQMRALKDSHDDMAFTPPLLATITARTLDRARRPRSALSGRARDGDVSIDPGLGAVGSANGGHGPIFGALAAPFAETALKFLILNP